jgi:hypothetical protein
MAKRKETEGTVVSNVPVPERYTRYPFHQMKVGDSFYSSSSTVTSAAFRHGTLYNKKFTVRKEGDGLRVWRIK